jgi:hypothetical protein
MVMHSWLQPGAPHRVSKLNLPGISTDQVKLGHQRVCSRVLQPMRFGVQKDRVLDTAEPWGMQVHQVASCCHINSTAS